MPTILDLCEIEFPDTHLITPSLSRLWNLALKPNELDDRPVMSTGLLYYENRDSVIFEGLKYIRFQQSGREEMYDLTKDFKEQHPITNGSRNTITQAQSLLQEHENSSEDLREQLYLTTPEDVEIDKQTLQHLKSLGYIQ